MTERQLIACGMWTSRTELNKHAVTPRNNYRKVVQSSYVIFRNIISLLTFCLSFTIFCIRSEIEINVDFNCVTSWSASEQRLLFNVMSAGYVMTY